MSKVTPKDCRRCPHDATWKIKFVFLPPGRNILNVLNNQVSNPVVPEVRRLRQEDGLRPGV
jgi:hypothetical protein